MCNAIVNVDLICNVQRSYESWEERDHGEWITHILLRAYLGLQVYDRNSDIS